jgi:hypothetical protein
MHKGFYIIKDTLDILFFTKQGRTVQTKNGIWFYINLSRWYSHSGYCKYFYAPAIIVALYLYDRFIKK